MLYEVITGSLQIIGPSLEGKEITIHVTIEDDVTIQTYANELKQVLLNILKNAEDALLDKKTDQPRIDITGRRDGDSAILEIEDNAGGIPPDIVGSIFDPYFSTKQSRDGTGLGLYMSKTIIDEHCQGKLSRITSYNVCYTKLLRPAMLRSAHSGKCIDVPRSSLENETRLIQNTCNGTENQLMQYLH